MPVNPFGQDDPLAPGGGGAWGAGAGAGAGGFGQGNKGESYAVGDTEFDVVDIAEPTAGATTATSNGATAQPVVGGSADKGKTKSLAAREAELNKREADLKRREAAATAGGPAANLAIKNWPKFYPIVHHDISADIPEGKRGITRAGFFIFLMTVTALTYNFIAVIIAAISANAVSNVAASIVFALIYFVVGIPGAWITWYQRLYRAMIFDGAVSFATFFFAFMIHIAFVIWSALSPGVVGDIGSSFAHTGLFRALEFFKQSGAADRLSGILYLAGAVLWGTLGFLSLLFLARVYKFFRTSGAEDRARAEVQQGAARGAVQLARA